MTIRFRRTGLDLWTFSPSCSPVIKKNPPNMTKTRSIGSQWACDISGTFVAPSARTHRWPSPSSCPTLIQMLSWWLKRLSLQIAACKRCYCRGRASPHPLWYGKSHLCAPKTTLSTEDWMHQEKNLPCNPSICCLGLAPCLFPFFMMIKDRESREGGRKAGGIRKGRKIKSQTHILLKVRFVSLLFCYHGHCYYLCYGLFSLQFIFKFI